ncbi:putative Glucose-1-phosphate adenylyltransferase small subunit 1, chloroplastic [Cocos nucifera]|uniref:glucose-1-phosphate adenylyltransferase n=2 Tax=Magnoliopsida TaxID=3398 RepID=A0A8K0IRK2_COCNU|nr:putative Glucose-1-phosphate adenylyltransferase small subunit 1, chloroplastic [Cocos nucifera]
MGANGISRISLSRILTHSTSPFPSPDRTSNDLPLCLRTSSNRGLSSSFHFSGEAFFSKAVLGLRRTSAGKRTPVLISPKAVSDSRGSQTCLDPDASRKRAKPAVPLGANYRLIDIPVSNCLNSNILKIYVLTQFNSASLNRHLARAYGSNMGGYNNEGFVEVLAAQQSPENPNWFQGTADAVRQYLWLFEEHNVMEFLILAGDHLYRMDYERFIQAHRETDADITVAALPMDERRATAFGLMKIDEEGRMIEFAEKPKGEQLKAMKVDTTILGLDEERAKEMPYIASMGIYVISKDIMLQLLWEKFPGANDFGSEVIPGATNIGMRVQAYLYDGYWEDIGTIEAFYNANLGITKKPVPDFSFYDRSSPIYTQPRYLPPSKMLDADVTDSVIDVELISMYDKSENCKIHHSVVGLRSCISEGAVIEDSLLMGADYYEKRAKPAVPLGANYRLIDIPVSNCLNSNILKIYVLTQFNSASLNRHLARAYGSNMGGYNNEGFVEVLAAQQSPENPNWFQGTADAVRQYLWLFEEHNVMEFLILAGDHLYRMDYERFIQAHRETDADITVAALPMDERRATAFGLMKIDEEGRMIEFAEKPKGEQLKAMKVDTTILGLDEERAKEMPYIASMGIYVISKDIMLQLLWEKFPGANDFGSEVIPGATNIGMRVQAYLYDGYWEDIGTIEAFYNANLGITKKPVPDFSFYDRSSPIYTQPRYLPPSKMLDADVTDSVIDVELISMYDKSENCKIHHSVVGLRSCISEGAVIEDSLLMGADYYETDQEKRFLAAKGSVPVGIGKNSCIKRAIIDKNARIGENVKIINSDNVQEAARETDGYFIKSGIVTVINDALIPSGTVI